MAFGDFSEEDPQPKSDINTTPLIDVLLVLLVMFIMVAPSMTHHLKLNLPEVTAEPPPEVAQAPSVLEVKADGTMIWNGETIDRNLLDQRLTDLARVHNAELRLRVENQVTYDDLAHIMGNIQNHRVTRVGFLTHSAAQQLGL